MNKDFSGHLAALLTIFIWGTTFISTKILLTDFKPIEILFFRFLIGLFILILIYPKRLRKTTKKQELTFALTGLCGVTLYYLLENIALTYSMASNIGVIISIAPFFTAILSHFILKEETLNQNFIIGFMAAMVGIMLISLPPAPKPPAQATQPGKGQAIAKKKVIRTYNRQVVFQAKTLQTEADIDDYVEKIRSQLKQLLKNCDEIKLN